MTDTIRDLWAAVEQFRDRGQFGQQRAVTERLIDAYQDAGDEPRGLALAAWLGEQEFAIVNSGPKKWFAAGTIGAVYDLVSGRVERWGDPVYQDSGQAVFECLFRALGHCPVVKRFGVDFDSDYGALTLDPGCVQTGGDNEYSEKTNGSGWTIRGFVKEDYYVWVNAFVARHPVWGVVYGDFESAVFASSEEAYEQFFEHHPPHAWDYQDI